MMSNEFSSADPRIGARYTGHVCWRLVAEAIVGFLFWLTLIALGWIGTLPLYAVCVMNSLLLYSFFIVGHDAQHGIVNGHERKLVWLNNLVGHLMHIPFMDSFSVSRRRHMRHHAFVNDPERDTERFLWGPIWRLPVLLPAFVIGDLFTPLALLFPFVRNRLPVKDQMAMGVHPSANGVDRQGAIERSLYIAVFAGVSALGFANEVLWLLYLPAKLGLIISVFCFGWLPHTPHSDKTRYGNTRVILFPGSNLLLRGHGYHAVHHLNPKIPYYRLGKTFREAREQLERRGVRVVGIGS